MTNKVFILFIAASIILLSACRKENSYNAVKEQLEKYTKVIELTERNGKARILVLPTLQGRIATSANQGENGASRGWIKLDNLSKKTAIKGGDLHGEERIWIGPLGSQFSFYYGQKQPLSEDNWKVPDAFNNDPFETVSSSTKSIELRKKVQLTNFIGQTLNMKLHRTISILSDTEVEQFLGTKLSQNIDLVAYETRHSLTNLDSVQWLSTKGLATPWNLSTFKGTNKSVVIIPIENRPSINYLYYLNENRSERLQRSENALWFRSDGKFRSKLGVPPQLSKGLIACYQPEINRLHVIQFKQNNDSLYFNSNVSVQENPYSGETIAIYNHGPMDLHEGKENTFFEMESMAAMKELKPSEVIHHYHRVYQFTGRFEELNAISQSVLKTNLKDCPLLQ